MRIAEVTEPQKLFEMPYLDAGQIDWGLSDPVRNGRRSGLIQHTPHTILRSDQFGALYRRVRPQGGDFAHIATKTGLITYFMEYTTTQRGVFGKSATQIKVWATIAPGMVGIAADIFFNVMLAEFDSMISDRIQTDDGRRFWLRRMAEAIQKGMHVGLLDHGMPMPYDAQIGFQPWLAKVDGWGQNPEHHERLFYISKKVIPDPAAESVSPVS